MEPSLRLSNSRLPFPCNNWMNYKPVFVYHSASHELLGDAYSVQEDILAWLLFESCRLVHHVPVYQTGVVPFRLVEGSREDHLRNRVKLVCKLKCACGAVRNSEPPCVVSPYLEHRNRDVWLIGTCRTVESSLEHILLVFKCMFLCRISLNRNVRD